MDLVLEGDEDGLLPPSLDEPAPPLDAPLVESLLELPEVDEELESPVLDLSPVDDDESDFIAFFRDSDG